MKEQGLTDCDPPPELGGAPTEPVLGTLPHQQGQDVTRAAHAWHRGHHSSYCMEPVSGSSTDRSFWKRHPWSDGNEAQVMKQHTGSRRRLWLFLALLLETFHVAMGLQLPPPAPGRMSPLLGGKPISQPGQGGSGCCSLGIQLNRSRKTPVPHSSCSSLSFPGERWPQQQNLGKLSIYFFFFIVTPERHNCLWFMIQPGPKSHALRNQGFITSCESYLTENQTHFWFQRKHRCCLRVTPQGTLSPLGAELGSLL